MKTGLGCPILPYLKDSKIQIAEYPGSEWEVLKIFCYKEALKYNWRDILNAIINYKLLLKKHK